MDRAFEVVPAYLNRLNDAKPTTLPLTLSLRSIFLPNRTTFKSALLVAGVFVILVAIGLLGTSGPSQATIDANRKPTTTTTTEPPPEGVFIVRIDNGVLRPANLEIDLGEIQIIQWINLDDREYVLEDADGAFRSEPLAKGDTYEFDYSTLPTGLHRYRAVLETESILGGRRIPGLVDSRPAQ